MINDLPPQIWKNTLDRHSPVPLHQQLSNIFTQSIQDGTLKPGYFFGVLANFDLLSEQIDQILSRLNELAQKMDEAPKSIAWKLRAIVGEKVRWYEQPEDTTRDAISMKLE